MPQDNTNTNDGVGLGVTGAVIATDLVNIDGGASAHVQYMKMGWGATGDQFYAVGTDTGTIATSKPLPIMLRHTDGTAVGAENNKLDINVAGHGITLHADISHRSDAGALYVQGTAGQTPIHVMGASASEPVIIQATGGTFSATNPHMTMPSMLFGLSGGNSAAPVGVTGTRLLVNHPENVTIISDGSGTYVQATGGFTLSTTAAATILSTTPSVVFGVTLGGGISPVGITGQRLLIDVDGETIPVTQVLTGSAGVGGTKTMPVYLMGESGPSAAAIGLTGPNGKHRLLVDLAGERVALDTSAASTHSGLFARATGGASAATSSALNMLPTIIYGYTAGGGMESIYSSGGRLQVEVGAATCITFDVSVNPAVKAIAATLDGGKSARALQIMGITHDSLDLGAYPPVVISGKLDGGTYPYPIGITTAGVAGSGGQWHILVTGGAEITKWSAGTLTVDATALAIRGLTAKAAGQDSIITHGETSGASWNWIRSTGGVGVSSASALNTTPSLMFGVTGAGGIEPVGVTNGMMSVGIGHPVAIDASATNPLRVQATGGLSASSGNNARLPLDVTVPSLIMGLSAGSDTRGAPVGMSQDMLKVNLAQGICAGKDSIIVYGGGGLLGICGSPSYITAYNTLPTLLHGFSAGAGPGGGSAAPIGMSGDALNVNLVNAGITVDVTVGSHVEVSNDYGAPLYVAGSSAGGACGGVTPYPVSVASDYLGHPVAIGGSAGMTPVEVRGASASTYWPVGITSSAFGGQQWKMASDGNMDSLGLTLDKTFKMFIAALGGDIDSDDIASNQFATKTQMDAMSPDSTASVNRIANAADMAAAKTSLATIASAVTSEPGQNITNQLQVDIVDVLQPNGFTAGQQALVSGSATRLQTEANPAGGFTLESGIKLKGHQDNTNFIYVGSSNVTSSTGFPLGPSEELFIEISNASKLYAISSVATGLTLCYIGS